VVGREVSMDGPLMAHDRESESKNRPGILSGSFWQTGLRGVRAGFRFSGGERRRYGGYWGAEHRRLRIVAPPRSGNTMVNPWLRAVIFGH
jgi:hypothetical protein